MPMLLSAGYCAVPNTDRGSRSRHGPAARSALLALDVAHALLLPVAQDIPSSSGEDPEAAQHVNVEPGADEAVRCPLIGWVATLLQT